jgi:hypothetical protein
MAVSNALINDVVEKVVLLAHTCCAVLVDAGAVCLYTTIEGTTDRTTRDKVIARAASTSQWVGGTLGEGLVE